MAEKKYDEDRRYWDSKPLILKTWGKTERVYDITVYLVEHTKTLWGDLYYRPKWEMWEWQTQRCDMVEHPICFSMSLFRNKGPLANTAYYLECSNVHGDGGGIIQVFISTELTDDDVLFVCPVVGHEGNCIVSSEGWSRISLEQEMAIKRINDNRVAIYKKCGLEAPLPPMKKKK